MPPPISLTRRTALAGALVLGTAGCSTATRDAGASPTASPSAATTSQLDPDEAIVSDLVSRLGGSTRLLADARTSFPGLPLGPLLAVQRTHLATLRDAAKAGRLPLASAATTPLAGTRTAALAQVRADATALQLACLDAAGRAESGAFARLLASMGCALSQRLAVLPR